MPITLKLYKCLHCDHEHKISTNHFGETYGRCPNCRTYGSIQNCMEPEAIKMRDLHLKSAREIKIFHYRFNISNEPEKKEYLALKAKLKGKGINCFNVIDSTGSKSQSDRMTKFSTLKVYTHYFFDNQWLTHEGVRAHDWYESIFPNKDIKQGYYLELTKELEHLRRKFIRCYNCGSMRERDDISCIRCLVRLGSA